MNETMFGPRNDEEAAVFAEESFRVDVQALIHQKMLEKGIGRREMAKRLGISTREFNQFFGHECDMTVRELAAIFHALGFYPEITLKNTEHVSLPQESNK